MFHMRWLTTGVALLAALALATGGGCAKAEPEKQVAKKPDAAPNVELPPAVARVVAQEFPGAEIAKAEVETVGGITLYDLEFKAGKGEIEVAADGTVIDRSIIVQMSDVPEPAGKVIRQAAEGATIRQLEKAEVRAEIKQEGDKATIVKFDKPKFVYEAEIVKGDQEGEIEVADDGTVVEPLKWKDKSAPPDSKEEKM